MRRTELKVLNEVIEEIPELLVDGGGQIYEEEQGVLSDFDLHDFVQRLYTARHKLITLAENAEADDQSSQGPQNGRTRKPPPSGPKESRPPLRPSVSESRRP